MGKWYGNVGFAHTTENNPGEWDSEIFWYNLFPQTGQNLQPMLNSACCVVVGALPAKGRFFN